MISKAFNKFDKSIMNELLDDAQSFLGFTKPNPTVAAALVKDNQIIAKGMHKGYGMDHAERDVFKQVTKDQSLDATLYVTLQPCTHYGQTPPCLDLILESGIKRLVYAIQDPNPDINMSLDPYYNKQIRVDVGCCQARALSVNEAYFGHLFQQPFVSLKAASSLDGKIAAYDGESFYLTNEISRKQVHHLRALSDAILVGIDTVLNDDPSLTVRYGILDQGYNSPAIFILDSTLKISPSASIFSSHSPEKIFIMCLETSNVPQWLGKKANIIRLKQSNYDDRWSEIMKRCFDLNYFHLFIEGGAKVFSSAMSAGIVDRFHSFLAPVYLNDQSAKELLPGSTHVHFKDRRKGNAVSVERCGDDTWVNTQLYDSEFWLNKLV